MGKVAPEAVTKLRAWRLKQGWSVEEFAALVGIHSSLLSRIERGLRPIRPHAKVQLARRVGARVSDLFDVDPVVSLDPEPHDGEPEG